MKFTSTDEDAAHGLSGLTLSGGWEVLDKIEKLPGQSGAFFSVCYKVRREKEICFLKAFDFSKFREIAASGKPVTDIMTDMLNAHRFERDLSKRCQDRHLDKIVTVKEAGETFVPNYSHPFVPYLIFDMADGDIRKRTILSNELDVVWSLKSLHSVAVGLQQLHSINVSHQDLKPSNILTFQEESKIGDVGRSLCKDLQSPYDHHLFPGDWNYAPPELLYGVNEADWAKKTFSTDCYLLGSLIIFYFTGTNMTALIRNYLPDEFAWGVWGGSFDEIQDYLLEAFEIALQSFGSSIENDYLKKELVILVKQLCYPVPQKRGHSKNLSSNFQYDLERFITKLDILYQRARFNLLK